MNLPNLLTSIRFLLIPVYVVVFMNGQLISSFLIMTAAGLTDILDGYIARKRGQITRIGILLDPLADKLMLITVVLSLMWTEMIPWSAAVLMFVRDLTMIAIAAFFHFRGRMPTPANRLGKATTALYYAAIMLIFFRAPYGTALLWAAVASSYVSSFVYLLAHRKGNEQSDKA
ncbi:CDP-alcohol phosphatidyltransferase family protein [Paenibacillus beijingensis]|uniref:CDP-diacylglycerol--glycerol-3-phosphate 3-phosphatidyltransferase n=1 Tax=Paenibacillus beijingensis TaxID=1126833 RepID=A0A0D5NGM1_9BACL|nr:CDP-alcohol phosphatidyltransferase family protein [Paenibacillus beijingensis]AJY74544.1 CDP-diacylglycerol--glycerol-3-phosphate 3-phosphatidyltransferase [Paenibacillus beijingensis]